MFFLRIKFLRKIFLHFEISEPDPTYSFVKPLSKKTSGFTKHEAYMECTVSSNMAQVSWHKGKTKLEVIYYVKNSDIKYSE